MAGLTIPYWEVALRLLLTVVLCGAIGFEREVRDQPAGFRTHILLGLGATLFTLVSAYGFEPFTRAALGSGGLQFDPTRISAQIVTGVGFLGAGAIIRRGGDVRGLTTAASLWATAAIGMAVGAGYLFGAAATTALAMATLYVLRTFRTSFIYPLRLDSAGLEITLKEPGRDPEGVVELLRRHGITVRTIDVEIDEEHTRYKLQVRIPPPHDIHPALAELSALPEVARVSLTGLRGFE
ncbi:MAG: MgtC/SapB family protein [Actinomycetota bacterium]|nr:MgtC/SapB family protein [Actinomycetota bacterium]